MREANLLHLVSLGRKAGRITQSWSSMQAV